VAGNVERLKQEAKRLRRELGEATSQLDHHRRVNDEQQATIRTLQHQMATLQEQVALLKKALFAPRRERHVPSDQQKLLFPAEAIGEQDASSSEAAPAEDQKSPPTKERKPKRKRLVFPEFLPVKRVECPLPDEQLEAEFGPDGWRIIKELVSRQIEVVPPQAYVVEEVRFVYGAKDAAAGLAPSVAEKSPSINPKGIFGPLAVAFLAAAKYDRHLPLYRIQEELLAATDMWFQRSVLSGSLLRPAERMRPLVDLMQWKILQSDYVYVDETTARVLATRSGASRPAVPVDLCGRSDASVRSLRLSSGSFPSWAGSCARRLLGGRHERRIHRL
jgi:transposase